MLICFCCTAFTA